MAKQAVQQREEHLPVEFDEDKYGSEGTFTDQQHSITPRVIILQALSPQCKKTNVAYVEGASPGMIFMSSYHTPLQDGAAGILFQPVLFKTQWVVRTNKETTGAANFVEAVDLPKAEWTQKTAERGNYKYYVTPEGHTTNEVHVHAGLVHMEDGLFPYAINFSGTGVFISKNFNGLISGRRTASGKTAARFLYLYRFRVKTQSNAMGEWGQWAYSAEGRVSPEAYEMGHDFYEALMKDRTSIDVSEEEHQQQAGSPRQQQSEEAPL